MKPRSCARIHRPLDLVGVHKQPEERALFHESRFEPCHPVISGGKIVVEPHNLFLRHSNCRCLKVRSHHSPRSLSLGIALSHRS